MKSSTRFATILLLCTLSLCAGTFAANLPLMSPTGLAVDAKGNLYVANETGDNILLYSPAYKQLTSSTIVSNIATPNAVAFDAYGDLWVMNTGNHSLTEFNTSLQPVVSFTNQYLSYMSALAVDGDNNLWVVTGSYYEILIFDQFGTFLNLYYPVGGQAYGIATTGGRVAQGSPGGTVILGLTTFLNGMPFDKYLPLGYNGSSIAADNKGNFYVTDGTTGNIYYVDGATGVSILFGFPGFVADGLAVDNARGRVYATSATSNKIVVMNSTGTIIHTIK
jgi:sugar lactone lactonase YvrE